MQDAFLLEKCIVDFGKTLRMFWLIWNVSCYSIALLFHTTNENSRKWGLLYYFLIFNVFFFNILIPVWQYTIRSYIIKTPVCCSDDDDDEDDEDDELLCWMVCR